MPKEIANKEREAGPEVEPQKIPLEIINDLESDPYVKRQFESDAGVFEHYTIGQHTLMMMTQFEKYFAGKPLPMSFDSTSFRKILAVHDIGKPEAIKNGDKTKQHEYTLKYAPEILEKQGLEDQEIRIAKSLLTGDPIGDCIKGGDEKACAERIRKMAETAGVDAEDFFNLMSVFYEVDAGSYTENATIQGVVRGVRSLDRLFRFDPQGKTMDFSAGPKERIEALRKLVVGPGKAEKPVEAEKEAPTKKIEQGDYPQFDEAKLKESFYPGLEEEGESFKGALDQLNYLKQEMGKDDFSLEKIVQAKKELDGFLGKLKRNSESLSEQTRDLHKHPFFNPKHFDHPYYPKDIDSLAKELEVFIDKETLRQQAVKTETESMQKSRTEARKEDEDAREKAEDKIREFDRPWIFGMRNPFSLGLPFSGTRELNKKFLERAKQQIAILDEVKALGDKASEIIGGKKNYWEPQNTPSSMDEMELVAGINRRYSEIYSAEQKAGNYSKSSAAEQKKSREALLEKIEIESGNLDLWKVKESPLFRAEAESEAKKVLEFEQFLGEKVLPLFGIDNESEAKEAGSVAPEKAPEFIEKAKERSFKNIRYIVRGFFAEYMKNGQSREEILENLEKAFGGVEKTSYIAWHCQFRKLEDVSSSGKILPAEKLANKERYDKAGLFMSAREYFSIRENVIRRLGFQPENPPVSAALGAESDGERGPAPYYGNVRFEFSPEAMRNKSVFTLGDSLNHTDIPHFLLSFPSGDEAQETADQRQLIFKHALLAKAIAQICKIPKTVGYIEAQVADLSPAEASKLVVNIPGELYVARGYVEEYKSREGFSRHLKSLVPAAKEVVINGWPEWAPIGTETKEKETAPSKGKPKKKVVKPTPTARRKNSKSK